MNEIQQLPEPSRPKKEGLRTHQIRVIRVLGDCKGSITRARIADRAGITPTVVNRALGYEDPEKRANFEANSPEGGFPSLITLGHVVRDEVDIDGLVEVTYRLSESGKKVLLETKDTYLPPPRDSYAS